MLSNVKQISGLYSICIFFYCLLQLLSAAEDSLVRVWHLTMTPETNTVEVTVPRTQYKAYFSPYSTLYKLLTVCFSNPLPGCTFAQRVCDRHTNLRRQVLRWRRLCLRSDRLRPEWDYPLHADIVVRHSCDEVYKCTFLVSCCMM